MTSVAVITGAGSGIGRATARVFLEAGWQVALLGRRAERLAETAGDAARALVVPCDVTVPAQVDAAFETIVAAFGRVDVLFNNAGTFGPAASVDEVEVEAWDATVAVNLTGAFLCARAAVRVMRAQTPQGGRIINNGSISAHTPRPLSVAYATTKHAISGMTKAIDLDGRAFGVTCGQIDIGNAATELTTGLGVGSGALQPDGTRRVEPTFPAADAARAVLFMAELPASANVRELLVTASGMPFGGRG
jgi:NAD(P)-dependent dehydrogenase (short-subunit alcohol dehydrogenase family)